MTPEEKLATRRAENAALREQVLALFATFHTVFAGPHLYRAFA
jgi:hypothetical protein